MPDYPDVWDRYDLAVSGLYDVLGPREAVAVPTVRSPELANRADLVVTASSRLADAAEQGLTAPTVAERELSMLRLVAGAAADLAIAGDLLRTQDGKTMAVRTGAPTLPRLLSDLDDVLRPGATMELPLVTRRAAGPFPRTVDEAVAQLASTAQRSYDAIASDVIGLSKMTLSGLITVPIAQVHEAAAVASSEIISALDDQISAVMRRVAQLLVQAYDKILRTFGRDLASKTRRQAAQWIQTLQSGTMLNQWLDQLYQKPRILHDIEAHAESIAGVLLSPALETALQEARGLAERFQRQHRTLEWLLRGLNFVKERLVDFQPWGPLGVIGIYVGTLGYTVYAGGDYVDWFRTERIQPLNRVPGLRTVVRQALKSEVGSAEE